MRVYYGKTSGSLKSTAAGGTSKPVIWGDWLDVEEEAPPSADFIVNWKVRDPQTGSIGIEKCRVKKADTQAQALLEMVFLDVGQGDGCVVNVPDGTRQRTIIVDAGLGDNTHNFLKWRFRYVDSNAAFEAAVITHPDSDHYKGFQSIFDDDRITFRNVFHNGLVEREVERKNDILGARSDGLCTEIYDTHAKLETFLSDPEIRGSKQYPKLLWTALSKGRAEQVSMAAVGTGTAEDGRTYLPGFALGDGGEATIEILGPVPQPGPGGELALREFGEQPHDGKFDVGKTKNGHSVILRLEYGGLRVIFGGDLNRPSEDYLLRHYGEIDEQAPLADAVEKASARLSADILKCCHHGSADVTDEFLEAVHPIGVVVSSGDQESHVHPRPEVLGLLGKKSRGDRPILLCTEILRSTPESLALSDDEKDKHGALLDDVANAVGSSAVAAARKAVENFWKDKLRRLVTVYGAINVRTDGRKLIVAFRKEKKATGSPWHIYEYKIVDGAWEAVAEMKPGH
jgi:beta-lactamase superfamily II metal-dependent hydrolase